MVKFFEFFFFGPLRPSFTPFLHCVPLSHSFPLIFVSYEEIKRGSNRRLVYEYRCDERLRTKDDGCDERLKAKDVIKD